MLNHTSGRHTIFIEPCSAGRWGIPDGTEQRILVLSKPSTPVYKVLDATCALVYIEDVRVEN